MVKFKQKALALTGAPAKSKSGCPTCHPDLKLGGGRIVGARCGNPRSGYDIYIGLDAHSFRLSPAGYPWEGEAPVQFCYPITDMSVPKNIKSFRKLIDWMQERLAEGKSIHIGCIGGHGRTGLVLAALYAQVTGNHLDATKWVRDNHCEHAVETNSQETFLLDNYKVKKQGVHYKSSFGTVSNIDKFNKKWDTEKGKQDAWDNWEEYPPIADSELSLFNG